MRYEISVDSEKAKPFDTVQDLLNFIKVELDVALQYGELVIDFKIYLES